MVPAARRPHLGDALGGKKKQLCNYTNIVICSTCPRTGAQRAMHAITGSPYRYKADEQIAINQPNGDTSEGRTYLETIVE